MLIFLYFYVLIYSYIFLLNNLTEIATILLLIHLSIFLFINTVIYVFIFLLYNLQEFNKGQMPILSGSCTRFLKGMEAHDGNGIDH